MLFAASGGPDCVTEFGKMSGKLVPGCRVNDVLLEVRLANARTPRLLCSLSSWFNNSIEV